jgi:hypothetical protein
MRGKTIPFLFVAMVLCNSADAVETERTKEFKRYKCKLTLPGPGYQWLDHTKAADVAAAIGDPSGRVMLIMSVTADPEETPMGETFTREYDRGFMATGMTKISGQVGRFKEVPCYQIHARDEADAVVTARSFPANGYIYSLAIMGSDLPVNQRSRLEPLFSAFEFIGEPTVPSGQPKITEEEVDRSMNKYKLIGGIFATLLAIIVLTIRDNIRRKRRKENAS